MSIFENIVNHKINTITAEELLKYANQFQVPLSYSQAKQISTYLRGKNINIFSDSERHHLLREISKLTGPATAQAVNQLFLQFKQ